MQQLISVKMNLFVNRDKNKGRRNSCVPDLYVIHDDGEEEAMDLQKEAALLNSSKLKKRRGSNPIQRIRVSS